jgi:hypothetical protein
MTTSNVAQPVAEQPVAERRVAEPAHTESAYAEPTHRLRTRGGRVHLAAVGLIAALASAWGGIVPFVGPSFGFSADGSSSWQWNLPHALLALVPGAVGVCLGMFVMARSHSVDVGRGRFTLGAAGMILMLCGAWFALGPWIWPVVSSSSHYFVPASGLRLLEYVLGYSIGVGLIIAACGGYVDGWASRFDRRALTAPVASEPFSEREAPAVRRDEDAVGNGAPVMGRTGVRRDEAAVGSDSPVMERDGGTGLDMPAENGGAPATGSGALRDQPGTARSGV